MSRAERRRGSARAGGTPIRDLLFGTALLAAAVAPSWRLYESPFLAVTVAGAWLSGLLVSFLTGLRRWPWYLQTVVAVAAALVVAVPLAVPSGAVAGVLPSLGGLGTFVTGLVSSWVDVLSVDPPLGTYDAVLVPVFVLVYVGGFLAWRGARRGSRWLVLLGPAALLLYGICFGARAGFRPLEVGAALVVIGLGWVLALRPPVLGVDAEHTRRLRAGAARRVVAGVAFALLCAVLGAAAARLVLPERREVLRAAFAPEYQIQRQVSPLQGFRHFVTGEEAERTVAEVDGLPTGAMLRVAVMDEYNGVDLQTGNAGSSGTFTRLPSSVARSEPASWDVRVRLDTPVGEWLPVAGQLSAVSVPHQLRDRLYFNRTADAAVLRDGAPAGLEYEFSSVAAAAPLRSGLADLTPGSAYQPDLVQLPEALVDEARAAWAKAGTPGAQLQIALDYLLAGGVSHGQADEVFSRSGHSAERLNLLAQEDPMVGDAEQYSAAFALLAREIGFPSRVVMGFVDTNADGRMSGSELTAWVEIQDAKRGWLAVDPNPEPREITEQKKSTEDAIARPRTVLPPDTPRQEDTITPRMDESPQQPQPEPEAWLLILKAVWWWTWRVGLSLLILSSPLWVLALIEALRRAARRRRDRKRLTVSGAWEEVRDEVIDAGIPVHRALTRREVAEAAGAAQVQLLARRTDELSFAPHGAQRGEVDEVWAGVKRARRELRGGKPRWQRWRQRYSWRSVVTWLRWMFRPGGRD
ncbi:MAG: transglutaminase-like domain-containing protein [Arthrobacter sp.]|nr:transglutaminase-like domain-containing protein [Arthrobacter sp.]